MLAPRLQARPIQPKVAVLTLLALLVTAGELSPQCAHAHAVVIASKPSADATIEPGEFEARLEFNTRIDAKRSRLMLQGPDGSETKVVLARNESPAVLGGRVRTLLYGRWKLRWQVLAVDGHITRGDIAFSVGIVAQKR